MTMHHEDINYMLVLDDRVFYQGLTGNRMKARRLGSLTIYMALSGTCRIKEGDSAWRSHELAVIPPYQTHQVRTDTGRVVVVMIETERLYPEERKVLMAHARSPEYRHDLRRRIRGAAARLAECAPDGGLIASDFDRIVLGRSLTDRGLDRRISIAIDELKLRKWESPSLASDLAAGLGLSASRFLHLFKEQTGVSFRNYRMWRRARNFLIHANHDSRLTDVALSLGYPDSSHFSHSIRKTYGLKPRSIRVGSQNLRVAGSPGMLENLIT